MRIVLLPGMDGTGKLLGPFATELEKRGGTPQIVTYPHDLPQSYAELIDDLVVPALPRDEPFVLLGESFSGPIALAVAQREPPGLRALVLAVTFAKPPREILLSLTRALPVKWMLSMPIPCWVAHKVMLGREACGDQATLCRLMEQIQPEVLTERLREVRELRLARKTVQLPTLYLRATEDLLLPADVVEGVREIVPAVEVAELPGPHLVLDTSPDRCAELIATFLAALPEA